MSALCWYLPHSKQHALQASKTDDLELKGTIRRAKNAIEAKKIARVVKVSTVHAPLPWIVRVVICGGA